MGVPHRRQSRLTHSPQCRHFFTVVVISDSQNGHVAVSVMMISDGVQRTGLSSKIQKNLLFYNPSPAGVLQAGGVALSAGEKKSAHRRAKNQFVGRSHRVTGGGTTEILARPGLALS